MAAWDPSQYLKFAGHRLRPALDLMGRIDAGSPATVYDLGCGTGNVTRILADRWSDARVIGVDSSPDMLAAARTESPAIAWVEADLNTWTPDSPADVLYSNAAFHWLDDHETLFPHLVGLLAPGGVLAVQMPRNHAAPSLACIIEAAEAGPWIDTLRPILRPAPVAAPEVYYDILRPLVSELEIWETVYVQALEGDNPVVEWTMGTALRPALDALEGQDRALFLAEYTERVQAAYPKQADGRTLLPFRRLFMTARK